MDKVKPPEDLKCEKYIFFTCPPFAGNIHKLSSAPTIYVYVCKIFDL